MKLKLSNSVVYYVVERFDFDFNADEDAGIG